MKIDRIMASVFCLVMFITITTSAQQKGGWITVHGQIKGFTNQLYLEDMSEFQYLVPPSPEMLIIPDSAGNCSIRFKADAPNYYRLGYNIIYLTPGTDLRVSIDAMDIDAALFTGSDAAACTYLKNTPAPKAGSYLDAGYQLKDTPTATITAIEQAAAARRKELALLKNVSAEFRRLENARIKADIINSIRDGEVYGIYRYDNNGKPNYLKGVDSANYLNNYRKMSLPKITAYSKNFSDASLMKLVVYRDIADIIIKQGGNPKDIQQIKDWYKCDSLVAFMRKVNDKQKLAQFNSQTADIKTVAYKNAVQLSLSNLMAFGNGDNALNFKAVDQSGHAVQLGDFKGKVIYVDIWATWCGPCMQEMPYFEKLKEKYKDNPNIVFVSLSIDSQDADWKKSLANRKANGIQWIISRYKLNDYNVVDIPRLLLIGKDFKVSEMNAPVPSDAGTTKTLDELLAK